MTDDIKVYRITARTPGGGVEVRTVTTTPERLAQIKRDMEDSWYTEIRIQEYEVR